jgi:O-antigen/teichoic acid export membrane protein
MSSGILKNKLAFSIGAYTLVNVINKGIPFLLLPLLTHYLSKEDYGILTNIESLLVITVTLIGLNASSALTRQYVKKDVNIQDYFTTILRVIVISFFIVTLAYSAAANIIHEFTLIPVDIIYFISIYAILDNISEILLAFWRMEDKPFQFGALKVSRTLIEVSISLLLVVSYNYDWFGRFSGLFLAGLLTGLFALVYLIRRKFLNGKYRIEYRKQLLSYGVPLIPHTISGVVIFYSDKLIITAMLGIEDNGLYSVAFTIGMAISLVQNSFNQAWVPWLYKKLAAESLQEKKKLVKITYIYMVAMLGIAFLLWLVTPFIYSFLGDDFAEGMPLVALIGFGFAFNGMYKMMINYVFYAEKTKIISIITVSLAILNILLNIWLIGIYGLIGSAYASTITFFLQFIVTWYISNRVFPMPWFNFR